MWSFNKFRTANSVCATFQAHTFYARLLLFDDKFPQPDVSARVNVPVVALSVFYSPVLSRNLMFFAVMHWLEVFR